jgi:hypothetical protein
MDGEAVSGYFHSPPYVFSMSAMTAARSVAHSSAVIADEAFTISPRPRAFPAQVDAAAYAGKALLSPVLPGW